MTSILRKPLLVVGLLGLMLLQSAGRLGAEPQNGWWWNPNESGRGFFVEMIGGAMYVGGYFYESDGRATWLTSGGPVTDPYRYEGTLQRYRNGQALFGDFRPPDPGVDVGPVVVQFTSDTRGTITWPGGTIPIERYVFGAEASGGFQPEAGWWWNEAESGTGYSIEVQGATAFVVAFVYDDAGNPVWYLSAGAMKTPTRYEGDWLQFAGGQTLGGPYRPPGTPANIGRIEIDFVAADEADIALSDLSAGVSTGFEEQRLRRRQRVRRALPPVRLSARAHWPVWRGAIVRKETQRFGSDFMQTIEHRFNSVVFDLDMANSGNTHSTYTLRDPTFVHIKFHQEHLTTGCMTDGELQFPVESGELRMSVNVNYAGDLGGVGGTPQVYPVPVVQVCPIPGHRPIHFEVHAIVQAHIGSRAQDQVRNFYPHCAPIRNYTPMMRGGYVQPIPGGEFETTWHLEADYGPPLGGPCP